MRKWIKQLVVVVTCMALVGCHSPLPSNGPTSSAASESNKPVAMGRYVEKTESIEEKIKDKDGAVPWGRGICLWIDEQGKLQATISNEQIENYERTDTGEWQQHDLEWNKTLKEKYPEITYIKKVQPGNDPDTFYIMGTKNKGEPFIATINKTELTYAIIPDISGAYVNNRVEVDKDGMIYLCNYDTQNLQKMDQQGNVIAEGSSAGYQMMLMGDKVVTKGEKISIFNKEDLKLEKEFDDIQGIGSLDGFFSNGNNVIFCSTDQGLYRIDQEGELIEQIIDGNLCALSSDYVEQAICYGDEFYFVYSESMEHKTSVKSYKYNADEPALPDKELVIWALSRYSPNVRDAVNLYRQQHPDTYVKIEELYNDDTYYNNFCQINADDLDQLNTELLAGKGPDLIVLDSLNYDMYQRQGVFEDLTKDIDSWEGELPLLDNLARGYTNEKNEIYAIPLGFAMMRGAGDKALLEQGFEFDTLAKLQKDSNERILLPVEAMTRTMVMMDICKDKLLTAEGKVNTEAMKGYLTHAKEIALTEKEIAVYSHGWRDSFMGAEGFKEKVCKADIEKINSPQAIAYLYELQKKDPNFVVTDKVEGKHNIAQGVEAVAINKNAKNKEGARELIHLALSDKVQQRNASYQFSVNENILKEQLSSKSFRDDNMIFFSTVKLADDHLTYGKSERLPFTCQEELKTFLEECKTAQIYHPIDENVRKIISDEANAFFNNEISVEQAVAKIEKKVNLYLGEQGK